MLPFDFVTNLGHYDTIDQLMSQFKQLVMTQELKNQWVSDTGSVLRSLHYLGINPWSGGKNSCVHVYHCLETSLASRKLEPGLGRHQGRWRCTLPQTNGRKCWSRWEDSRGFELSQKSLWFISALPFEGVDLCMIEDPGAELKRLKSGYASSPTESLVNNRCCSTQSSHLTRKCCCASPSYSRPLDARMKETPMDCWKLTQKQYPHLSAVA